MKVAFDRLKNKVKVFLMVLLTLVSTILVVISFFIDNDYIKILLGTAALIILIFLFLMLVWYFSYQEKFKSKDKYNNVDTSKSKDLIVEYFKVFDNHYLRYVYVEGLTLAENLDKVELGEENLVYVDDVDNKYDNEALALFYKDYKLGYFFKNGKFRELYRKYKDDKDFKIITKICHLDLENNKIKVKIAFYKSLDSEDFETVNVSINNNYDYLKVGYWLSVNQIINDIGNKEYKIEDIYGKKLDIIEINSFDQYSNNFYAKIINIGKTIDLKIYHINK